MNSPRPQSPVMKPAEVMQLFDCSRTTVYEMAHGPLAHAVVRVGAKQTGLRFVREKVMAYLHGGVSPEKGR